MMQEGPGQILSGFFAFKSNRQTVIPQENHQKEEFLWILQ